MPELPEVETIARYLRSQIKGREIVGAEILNSGERHFNANHDEVITSLLGSKINDVKRYGKWLLFDLSKKPAVAHLRMSGIYEVTDNPIGHPHTRFHLKLDSGQFVNYLDQRRFGTFHFTDSVSDYLKSRKLGPDALTAEFNAEYLFSALQGRKKGIYSTLLDQSVVAGLGNIYVNEVLHRAGVHPLLPAHQITPQKCEQIVNEAKSILNLALEMKGTSLVDNLYRNPEGGSGEFYKLLQVYGKKKDSNVEVFKVGGRSVFVHKDTKL